MFQRASTPSSSESASSDSGSPSLPAGPAPAAVLQFMSDATISGLLPALAFGEAPASRVHPRFLVARMIDGAVLVALGGAGLLCPWGVGRFYLALLAAFAFIGLPVLAGSALLTWFGETSPTRLQGIRRRPRLLLRGARDTSVAALVAAALVAWPLSRAWAGLPIGLNHTLAEAGGLTSVVVQTFLALLALDAWLYWKHRLLHTRLMFPFHRAHHTYRDPTSMTSFAVGPVEALLTFWPVLLVAWPAAHHYAPLYYPQVVEIIAFNLYLHCGASIGLIEATLPRLLINTSVFHNVHHANAETHFAEALTLWDHLCGTDGRARRART